MEQSVPARLGKRFPSWFRRLEWCDLTRQRIRWTKDPQSGSCIEVSQQKAIDELEEIPVERNTKDNLHCTPPMHTRYRSLVGQINWLQSRTQFQCCYKFSRCASKAASPTIGDVNNKLARQLKSQPVKLQFWPLTRPLGIRLPDASRQRSMAVFLAESRERSSKDGMSYGCLTDDESQKIKRTVLSTTVAKLFSFMKCFGSCQFLRGLWMNISGEVANIHMRTDAKNLVTTARTFHYLPEQNETIHMISMLRKACSGSIHYLAHIPTQNCLADCLTKASATADHLITAVKTEELLEVDIHPNFRILMEHKEFLLHCGGRLCTQKKNVLVWNALKVSLVPDPQERPFHVMFVRKQHTQEPKQPMVCDWNHLSLSNVCQLNLPRNVVMFWNWFSLILCRRRKRLKRTVWMLRKWRLFLQTHTCWELGVQWSTCKSWLVLHFRCRLCSKWKLRSETKYPNLPPCWIPAHRGTQPTHPQFQSRMLVFRRSPQDSSGWWNNHPPTDIHQTWLARMDSTMVQFCFQQWHHCTGNKRHRFLAIFGEAPPFAAPPVVAEVLHFRVEFAEYVVSPQHQDDKTQIAKKNGQSHQRHLGKDVPEPTTNKQLYVNHKRLRRDAFVVVVVVVGPWSGALVCCCVLLYQMHTTVAEMKPTSSSGMSNK